MNRSFDDGSAGKTLIYIQQSAPMVEHRPLAPFESLAGGVSQKHYACADMVRIDCDSTSELAILLEIWEGGGVAQTSFPIAAGSPIAIAVENTQVTGEVTKCEPDHDFGYLIDIDITAPAKWFPQAYVPAWYIPAVESTVRVGDFVC